MPVPREVECRRAADAEVRPEQRTAARRRPPPCSTRRVSSTGNATPVERRDGSRRSTTSGASAGVVVDVAVAQQSREFVAEAVAARLGQRLAASRQYDDSARGAPGRRLSRTSKHDRVGNRPRAERPPRAAPFEHHAARARPPATGRRAPCARSWSRGTTCRTPPRAAARRGPRRTPRRDRPERRAARAARHADEPPQKSRSLTMRLVTLQRDPPLTRILAPTCSRASSTTTRHLGLARAAKMRGRQPGGARAHDDGVGVEGRRGHGRTGRGACEHAAHSGARCRGPASAPRGRAVIGARARAGTHDDRPDHAAQEVARGLHLAPAGQAPCFRSSRT